MITGNINNVIHGLICCTSYKCAEGYCPYWPDCKASVDPPDDLLKDALFVLQKQQGHWIDKPYTQWPANEIRTCSICGWEIHKNHLRAQDLNWNYCPNCGSRMNQISENT